MRYMGIADYEFLDTMGRLVTVKEMRDIPKYTVGMSVNKEAEDDLDEIASRNYIFGEDGERDSYALHEANITQLLDARFDYARLKKIAIPI